MFPGFSKKMSPKPHFLKAGNAGNAAKCAKVSKIIQNGFIGFLSLCEVVIQRNWLENIHTGSNTMVSGVSGVFGVSGD